MLPQEVWRETDSRRSRAETSISAIIQKALLSYFELTGGAQAAGRKERASPDQLRIGLRHRATDG